MMKKPVLWIIAGTTEGRELVDQLRSRNAEIYVSVATEYGRELIPSEENLHVEARRLSREEMVDFMQEIRPDCVIDTTHPYARIVTDNIREACRETATDYIRLQRPGESDGVEDLNDLKISGKTIYAENTWDAAQILKSLTGAIFLTCGSKEIEAFAGIPDYRERVYARVLPMPDVMEKCEKLGFKKTNISYMQGPFSKELNMAMLKDSKAKYLVTKDSGEAGGFKEKVEAARELGITVVMITRGQADPDENMADGTQQVGTRENILYSQDQLLQKLVQAYSLEWPPEQAWFPLFVPLKNKRIVVFGGGKIALRRIRTLIQFDPDITVIAPEVAPEIHEEHTLSERLIVHSRKYQQGDCMGADMVLAATNDGEVNRMISEECTQQGIPVSVADCREHCTFYFPAVIKHGNLVIGLTASGEDHAKVRKAADKLRLCIDEILE